MFVTHILVAFLSFTSNIHTRFDTSLWEDGYTHTHTLNTLDTGLRVVMEEGIEVLVFRTFTRFRHLRLVTARRLRR